MSFAQFSHPELSERISYTDCQNERRIRREPPAHIKARHLEVCIHGAQVGQKVIELTACMYAAHFEKVQRLSEELRDIGQRMADLSEVLANEVARHRNRDTRVRP